MMDGAKRLTMRDARLVVPLLSGVLLQSRSLQSGAILLARLLASKPRLRWRPGRSHP